MSISREFITSRSPSWRNLAILNSVWRRFTTNKRINHTQRSSYHCQACLMVWPLVSLLWIQRLWNMSLRSLMVWDRHPVRVEFCCFCLKNYWEQKKILTLKKWKGLSISPRVFSRLLETHPCFHVFLWKWFEMFLYDGCVEPKLTRPSSPWISDPENITACFFSGGGLWS